MLRQYEQLWNDKQWRLAVLSGLVLLLLSFATSIFSNNYASLVAGQAVGDLLLDRLPLMDVTVLHVYAATTFWLGMLVVCLANPAYLPFALKTTAVFLLVRAVFVALTHLGAPNNLLEVPDNLTSLYIAKGDLFFSGHVGGPFLFALIFWEKTAIRFICLVASIFFAVIVLLGGIHYSIDVFAAYFISHSICLTMKKRSGYWVFVERQLDRM